ncbi:MAG: hypothetical protein AAGI38_22235 [Bacteroidota bacterium]
MRKLVIILVISFTTLGSCKQLDDAYLDEKFEFTIDFHPSFHDQLRVIIRNDGNQQTGEMRQIIFYPDKLSDAHLKGENFECSDSLLGHKFDNFSSDNLIQLKPIEFATIPPINFQQFKTSLRQVDLRTKGDLRKEGWTDGISILFRYKSNSVDNLFAFRCPFPSDTLDFKVVDAVLNVMESSFHSNTANEQLKSLREYF